MPWRFATLVALAEPLELSVHGASMAIGRACDE